MKKNSKYINQTKKELRKPFYIGLNSDQIVSNSNINQAFKLTDLVAYITQGIKTEREKVIAIADFICRSISYDVEGANSNKYAHSQYDVTGILTSGNRIAVCAGYSHIFDSLAKLAHLDTRRVSGYTKTTFQDVNYLGGLHAWNIVKVDGKEYYLDVTWSDGFQGLISTWMFVDPELMILSHFPNDSMNNLFDQEFTKNVFKNREVVMPIKDSVKMLHYPIKGCNTLSSNVFRMKFKKRVNLYVKSCSIEISKFSYSDEESYFKNVGYKVEPLDYNSYFKNDTFYVDVPISKNITALDIMVEEEYYIKTIVYKGDQKSIFKDMVNTWDDKHGVAFSAGILAAIKIGNKAFLKEKLGSKYSTLYDKKGNWKLSKTLLKNVMNWDGSSYGLINDAQIIDEKDKTTKLLSKEFKFNDSDKLLVVFHDNKYEFLTFK